MKTLDLTVKTVYDEFVEAWEEWVEELAAMPTFPPMFTASAKEPAPITMD